VYCASVQSLVFRGESLLFFFGDRDMEEYLWLLAAAIAFRC
jgi:hypothetical protein